MQLASRAARAGAARGARGCSCCSRCVVQAGYFAYAGARLPPTSCSASTSQRDAYSSIYYTLLGADHAHVALGILFNVWLLCEARARPDDLPRERRAGDRLVLARRQRADARRDRARCSRPAHDACAGSTILQWFGLFGGALLWAAQVTSSATASPRRECSAGGARWGIRIDLWQVG